MPDDPEFIPFTDVSGWLAQLLQHRPDVTEDTVRYYAHLQAMQRLCRAQIALMEQGQLAAIRPPHLQGRDPGVIAPGLTTLLDEVDLLVDLQALAQAMQALSGGGMIAFPRG